MSETIQTLAELGVATLAMIAVVIIAYTVFNRSKSDTNTLKVFTDILSGSFKSVLAGVEIHGEQSTTRHNELVVTQQTIVGTQQTIAAVLAQIMDGNNTVIETVNKLSEHVGTYTANAEITGNKIMETVTPLEQALRDIRSELVELRKSVDEHLVSSTEFRDEVNAKTGKIENRLLQVEKQATQETPVIKPDDSESESPIEVKEKDTTNAKPTSTNK